MKNNWLKTGVQRWFFPTGAQRTILLGPLRGMVYRVGPITGLSPLYSGAERGQQRAFHRHVAPGDVVLDAGANWGLHSLYLSRLVGTEGVVLAAEPLPAAIQELEWHAQANHCSNIRILPLAVGDRNGTATLAFRGWTASGLADAAPAAIQAEERTGLGGALQWAEENADDALRCARFPGETIAVTVRTLDSLVEEHNISRLKLIKIDVEGAESLVLEGGRQTIERFRPHLVIDLHTPEQDVRVAEFLAARGYRFSRLDGPPILNTAAGWPDPEGVWGSILARP